MSVLGDLYRDNHKPKKERTMDGRAISTAEAYDKGRKACRNGFGSNVSTYKDAAKTKAFEDGWFDEFRRHGKGKRHAS